MDASGAKLEPDTIAAEHPLESRIDGYVDL